VKIETKDRKFVYLNANVKRLVDSQAPSPKGTHFMVIKKNSDGRPCAWGKGSEFADCVQVADEQWDAHGDGGCCYPGETVGEYEVHLVSSQPISKWS